MYFVLLLAFLVVGTIHTPNTAATETGRDQASLAQSSFVANFNESSSSFSYYDDDYNGTYDRAVVSVGIYVSETASMDVSINVFKEGTGDLIASRSRYIDTLASGTTIITANVSSEVLSFSMYTGNITVVISGTAYSQVSSGSVYLNPINQDLFFDYQDFEVSPVVFNRTRIFHQFTDIDSPANGLYDISQLTLEINITRPIELYVYIQGIVEDQYATQYNNEFYLQSHSSVDRYYYSAGIHNITLNASITPVRDNQLIGSLQYDIQFSFYDLNDWQDIPQFRVGNYSINYQDIDTTPQFYVKNSFGYNFTDTDANGLYDQVSVSYQLNITGNVSIDYQEVGIYSTPHGYYERYLGGYDNYTYLTDGIYNIDFDIPYDSFYTSQYAGRFNFSISLNYMYNQYGIYLYTETGPEIWPAMNWTDFDVARVSFDLTSVKFLPNMDNNSISYSVDMLVDGSVTSGSFYGSLDKTYTINGGYNRLGQYLYLSKPDLTTDNTTISNSFNIQPLIDRHYKGYIIVDLFGAVDISVNPDTGDSFHFRLQEIRSQYRFDYTDWTADNSGPSDNSSSTTTTTSTSTPANNSDGAITAPSLPVSNLAVSLAILTIPMIRVIQSRRRKN